MNMDVVRNRSDTEVDARRGMTAQCSELYNPCRTTGDLGAPIVWFDPDSKKYNQVGIVSYNKLCNGKTPTLSTNVFYYYNWIQQAIEDTIPEMKTCSKI